MTLQSKKQLTGVGLIAVVLLGPAVWNISSIGGSLIIFPDKRQAGTEPPPSCQIIPFNTGSIVLQGWRGDAVGRHRGTLVYLHGLVLRWGHSEKAREWLTTPNERRLAAEVFMRRVGHFTRVVIIGSREMVEG